MSNYGDMDRVTGFGVLKYTPEYTLCVVATAI